LNHYYVATAAHCVHRSRLSDITIYLGEHDTKDTGRWLEPLQEESFAVVDRIIHPRFKYMLTQPDRYFFPFGTYLKKSCIIFGFEKFDTENMVI